MLMLSCSRRFDFCAGHRVMGHENKCAHLHGHNYSAIVTLEGFPDVVGRVLDFATMKRIIGDWIEREWDHGFILHADDHEAIERLRSFVPRNGDAQKLHLLPVNPTAENLAQSLLETANQLVYPHAVRARSVKMIETRNCYATAILGHQ